MKNASATSESVVWVLEVTDDATSASSVCDIFTTEELAKMQKSIYEEDSKSKCFSFEIYSVTLKNKINAVFEEVTNK